MIVGMSLETTTNIGMARQLQYWLIQKNLYKHVKQKCFLQSTTGHTTQTSNPTNKPTRKEQTTYPNKETTTIKKTLEVN